MAGRPPKNLNQSKKHYTKEEIEQKKQIEARQNVIRRTARTKPPQDILREDGKKLFTAIAKDLQALGLLTNLDIYNLALFVNALLDYQECERLIKEHGRIVVGCDKFGNKTLTKNPAVAMQKDSVTTVSRLGISLGLDVGARQRYLSQVQNEEAEAKPLDKFETAIATAQNREPEPIPEDVAKLLKSLDI